MKTLYETGFFLEPAQKQGMGGSVIGGIHNLVGSVSPNSGRALVQLASIRVDAGAVACKAWGFPDVPLLYSWTCAICEGRFTYKYLGYGIDILKYIPGEAYSDFPYEAYPDAFDQIAVNLIPLTQQQQRAIISINNPDSLDSSPQFSYLAVPRHQIGGIPYFIPASPSNSTCPCCGEKMSFFASIGDDTFSDPRGFAGNEFVQLIYEICVACKVVSVDNFCD